MRLFTRAVAFVYLVAFLSLAVQIQGLVGSQGILPVAPWMEAVTAGGSAAPWLQMPSLLWLSASDVMLSFLCWGGAAAAFVALLGYATGALLFLCWAFYLSLVHGGGEFLAFQWDTLLLETGFLALVVSPWGWRPRSPAPPRAAVWLLRLLLFKLMLSSGVTKLTWGDPTWANLTALEYHWWTQPLPTPLARLASSFPDWMQRTSCALMFVIEIAVPFAAFGPRRLRLAAATALAGLQLLIAATGSYGFFNLLSLVLCLPLLDDAALGGLERRRGGRQRAALVEPSSLRRGVVAGLAALTLALSVTTLGEMLRWSPSADSALVRLRRATSPFFLNNGYGLFRVMTTTRPEIEVEVSQDGRLWRPLVFAYKPGPLERRPPWVAPHMPRLDWQMWFAALSAERVLQLTGGRAEPNLLPPWLQAFAVAVLEGREPVLGLLADEAGRPPKRLLRMSLYQYRLAATSGSDDQWWQRVLVGQLMGPLRGE